MMLLLPPALSTPPRLPPNPLLLGDEDDDDDEIGTKPPYSYFGLRTFSGSENGRDNGVSPLSN